jgi:hypothetical protein
MPVQFKAGSFTIATTDTVSKVVTGVGFQPQGYALFTVGLTTASANGTGDMRMSEGMTDGTRQYAQGIASDDAASNTTTRRSGQTNRVLYLINQAGTDLGSFAHSAMGADGFTLSTTTAVTANTVVYYLAWAGFTNQYLDVFTLPGATGSFARTAAGFDPDALLWMTSNTTTLGTTASAIRSAGWSLRDGTQFSIGQRIGDGATDNYSSSSAATDRTLFNYSVAGASQTPEVSLTSHDPTGFTANRLTGTGLAYVAVMHFDGGVWAAGTTTAQAGTGTFTLSTPGITPAMVMLAASNITTASRTTPFESGEISLGVATSAADQFAINNHTYDVGTASGGNFTEEYTRGDASHCWVNYERSAVNTYSAVGSIALQSFAAGQVTLNQDDADPTAILIGWLACGEASGAATPRAHALGGLLNLRGGLS